MRIPIPVVILLCFGVVGGVWWHGTRLHDFLTPPPESELAAIRENAAASIPPADHPEGQDEDPAATAKQNEPPARIEPGDFNKPPTLVEYREDAWMGAAALAKLAAHLEEAGQPQRALLAWERVLDSATADASQALEAVTAIQRLRSGLSAWNPDPGTAIAITLHAGTGKSTAVLIEPVLVEIADELTKLSSGILRVSAHVTSGNDIPDVSGPPPVALWFSGASGDSRTTEVLSFTAGDAENLHERVRMTVFRLLRGYLGRTASITIPEITADGEPTGPKALWQITRLAMLELGSRLNQTDR